MFDTSYDDLSCSVKNIEQFDGRMLVGGKIRTTVTVIMNVDTGIFEIIEMLINSLFHI